MACLHDCHKVFLLKCPERLRQDHEKTQNARQNDSYMRGISQVSK